jgi:tetratricopeptide (TPR) repeat protein
MDKRPVHNLPERAYQRLIGRESDIREIMVKLGPKERTWIVAIEGIGGLGKTALAQEVVWRYVEEYAYLPQDARFDAIIWAAASPPPGATLAPDPGAEAAYTALEHVFRAVAEVLHIPTLLQVAPAERQKMCWAALQRQERVLLVVDNLEEDEDGRIYAFLRDLPARALVTTRFHEDLPYPLRLAPLGEAATGELLAAEFAAHHLTPTAEQVDQLARGVCGLPLAARLVVGLCEQEGIAAALPRLGDAQSALARGVLGQLVARVQAQHPAAYETLLATTFFDLAGGATADALDACVGADAARGERARAWLNYVNLATEARDRYMVLPITREYAEGELRRQPTWEREARGRWVAHYRGVAARLDDPARYPRTQAETANLMAVLRWLSENERLEELSHFFTATQEFLYAQSRWDELLDVAKHLLEYVERGKSQARSVETLIALMQTPVDIYRRRDQFTMEGLAWLGRVARLAGQSSDRLLHAELSLARRRLLCNDGSLAATAQFYALPHLDSDEIAHYLNMEDPDFTDDMKSALRDFERAGRADKLFQAHATLGNFYRLRQDYDRAVRYYDHALAVLQQQRPRTPAWREARAAVVRASQGLIAGRRGDRAKASEILGRERIALIDEVDVAEVVVARAYYEHCQGHRDKAFALYTDGLSMKTRLGLQHVALCLEDRLWSERVGEAGATPR